MGIEVPKQERHRMGFVDLVHALMRRRITGSPAAPSGVTPRRREEVTESFPPVVCGGLFLVFPAPHNEINDA
ncbi:hypothetical protein OPV22_019949 [Ensete ventricosum]|uniref:Uncharacterized protein n=1 Tax=Ensete ventricosum TaxID=4639 RepID=A0AAV8QKC1_ENSVE|nr:hypothetical protein OPV22_019949 [Ensete ventricosum]